MKTKRPKPPKTTDLSHITTEDVLRAQRQWYLAYPRPNILAWPQDGFRLNSKSLTNKYGLHYIVYFTFGYHYVDNQPVPTYLLGTFMDGPGRLRYRSRQLYELDTPEVFQKIMKERGFEDAEALGQHYQHLLSLLGPPTRGTLGDNEHVDC